MKNSTEQSGVSVNSSVLSGAIFPGSFDPLTLGHVDIITRALRIFDRVVVGVLDNPEKKGLFRPEERVRLIRAHFDSLGENFDSTRVEVDSFSGLLVQFAKKKNVRVILRGLRAISDFDYETQMALMNRTLSDSIETFFLVSSEKYSYVSSSLVKQVAPYGGDVSGLVPPIIVEALQVRGSAET